ncbi:MAG: S41 family peptidase [Flavobacteriales bacterium]|nr:S41 family peptidase [Flavobacteriales bacterium]MCB0816896.1 S41 family peptidase [Flavobacteriales bacterium]MCB9181934.1 S41 family peptidase [Flavobacteriales bacterium]MCB9200767.1 S41 family peptidase [Flavobacteriales bacterium]HOP43719.1 S41 family peptidase [Flavobacteriales bacterium]
MSIRNMPRWRTLLIGGALAGAGALSIGAADNYFEISKNLEIFNELYKELNIYYVDDTSPGKLMKTGIDAMLGSLDPYTNFIPESDIEDYRFMTTGQYGGIGALIRRKDDKVYISEPYEGFPSAKAGIWAGDEIYKVDGREVRGMDTDEVSKLLKGQAGTTVEVTMLRGDAAPMEYSLTREEIKIPDVPYKGFLDADSTVGYIKLNSFTQTASHEVRTAFKELKDHGMQRLVFDLRGNGGGLLREAVNIVNLFVPKGELVVETKGRIAEWDKTYRTLSEPLDTEMPMVVLVDGGSASASEIVSGALQDLDRAVILGERTFGKGLVQQTRDLFYNSKLKVTVAKYYIPSGRCIQKLDYAHRDSSGKATSMADSLLTEFSTRNGRPVFDGRGILPDVLVEEHELPKVVGGLLREDLFFDYATRYRRTHETAPPARDFLITDPEYQAFLDYLSDKEFDYETESMAQLEELVETAKRERYLEHVKPELDQLREELRPKRDEELVMFRDDIAEILRNELVARYHFQTGRAIAALDTDPYVREALDVLGNGTYGEVLAGTGNTGN